jgi:UDP-4-amino-4-deoxy-L-arabinose-oxoglutarate aminotransferase
MSAESPHVPLSRCSVGEDEVQAVAEVIRSGWLTTGPRCLAFEREFAAYVGAKAAIAVQHGTSALLLCLQELDLPVGAEVIVPAMTWPSAAAAALSLGLAPVLADVDPRTLNLTAESVARVLTSRSRVVIAVHHAGLPYDERSVAALADGAGVVLIDDAAHAVGARYEGAHVGARARASCFSFHPLKNMTTAEGGMITTHDESFAARLRGSRLLGVTRDAWARYGGSRGPHYDITSLSLKHNMTDIQAAMGLVQLHKLAAMTARRRAVAERYLTELAGLDGLILPDPGDERRSHCWHLFTVRTTEIHGPRGRDAVLAGLGARNIAAGIHFIALPDLTYYREALRLDPADTPVAVRAGRTTISLPLFPDITDAEQSAVIRALRDIFS